MISPDLIFRSANKAAERAKRVVDFIKSTLEEDTKERESGTVKGFEDCLRLKKILSKSQKEQVIEKMEEESSSGEESSENDDSTIPDIVHIGPHTVVTKQDLKNFEPEDSSSSESSEPEEKIAKLEIKPKESKKKQQKNKKSSKSKNSREDSEDEETVVMTSMEP